MLKKSQANSSFGQFKRRKRSRRDVRWREPFQNPLDQTLRNTQCRQEQYFWVDAALWSFLGCPLWQEFVRHYSAVSCQNWIWTMKWRKKSSHYFRAHLHLLTLVLWLSCVTSETSVLCLEMGNALTLKITSGTIIHTMNSHSKVLDDKVNLKVTQLCTDTWAGFGYGAWAIWLCNAVHGYFLI